MKVDYGAVALIPKGDFDSTTQYHKNEIVSYQGSSYIVKENDPPIGTLPTNTAYFTINASGTSPATSSTVGTVKPDNSTIEVDNNGVISVKSEVLDRVSSSEQVTGLKSALNSWTNGIGNVVFGTGNDITASAYANGYKIKQGGVATDANKTTKVYPISTEPIYIKSQDGYQYRSATSAGTAIATYLGEYEGYVFPVSGANYVAISFDTPNASNYGAQYYIDKFNNLVNDVDSMSDDVKDIKSIKGNIAKRTNQLFDRHTMNIYYGMYVVSGQIVSLVSAKTIVIPVNVTNQTYITVHRAIVGNRFQVSTIGNDSPSVGDAVLNTVQSDSANTIRIAVDSTVKALLVFGYNSSLDTDYTPEQMYADYMVQYGREFTGYEKYYEVQLSDEEEKDLEIADNLPVVDSKQLFDYKNAEYFNGYLLSSGLSEEADGFKTALIPVTPTTQTHVIIHRGIKGNRFVVGAFSVANPTTSDTPQNSKLDNNAESLTLEIDSSTKCIAVYAYSKSADEGHTADELFGSIMVQYGQVYTGYENYGKKLNVSTAYIEDGAVTEEKLDTTLQNAIANPLHNSTINCLGDSFTDDGTSWEFVLKGRIPSITTVHVAKGGSAIVCDYSGQTLDAPSFLSRIDGTAPKPGGGYYTGLSTSADITVIFGGINDCRDLGSGEITMGTISSAHDTTTFYGGMQLLLDRIIAMIPDQFIFGVIPPSFQPNAPYATYIGQVQEAERDIYHKYHIPYIDLAYDCFAMSENSTVMALYRKSIESPTNYHPNALGAKKICDLIQGKLEMMYQNDN